MKYFDIYLDLFLIMISLKNVHALLSDYRSLVHDFVTVIQMGEIWMFFFLIFIILIYVFMGVFGIYDLGKNTKLF